MTLKIPVDSSRASCYLPITMKQLPKAIREKLEHRTPCCDTCPGWAVIGDRAEDLAIERCDECWHGVDAEHTLTDDEAAKMPGAKSALAKATARALKGPRIWTSEGSGYNAHWAPNGDVTVYYGSGSTQLTMTRADAIAMARAILANTDEV